jgi:transcriptional regulator with XRE-family HTH domain
MALMARNCKARRLEKGYSRRTFSEMTGIPAPTLERFEKTGVELEIINRNKKRQKGR